MKVLVLDDSRFRHKYFQAQLQGHEVVSAWNYTQFCQALQGQGFDLICLDHDLGDFLEADKDGDRYLDGRDCVRFMTQVLTSDKPRPRCVLVHSWNPPAAQQMMNMLWDHGFTGVRRWSFNDGEKLADVLLGLDGL